MIYHFIQIFYSRFRFLDDKYWAFLVSIPDFSISIYKERFTPVYSDYDLLNISGFSFEYFFDLFTISRRWNNALFFLVLVGRHFLLVLSGYLLHSFYVSNDNLRYLSEHMNVYRTYGIVTFSFCLFLATSYTAFIAGYSVIQDNSVTIIDYLILKSYKLFYFETEFNIEYNCYIYDSIPLDVLFSLCDDDVIGINFDRYDLYTYLDPKRIFFDLVSLWLAFEPYCYIDRVSFSLIWVTNLIILICMINIESKRSTMTFSYSTAFPGRLCISDVSRDTTSEYNCYLWIVYLLIIQISLLFLFSTDNIIVFFIAFEATLLPFYLWIATGGVRDRRWHAGYYLVFYTLVGSIGMLWSICNISLIVGSTSISYMYSIDSMAYDIKESTRLWYSFICLSIALLIKFPVFPFATWLPEAHVEASAEASTLLASVLLKVAPYGFYRIIMHLFPIWLDWSKDLFIYLGLLSGLIYVLSLSVQTDLKRIIAYTSIVHMSIILCLLVSSSIESIYSALLMAILHSFCSAGLFLLLGYLYDSDKTKNLNYLGGMAEVRPVYSFFFFVFNLVNIGYPLVGSFISEFIAILVPISQKNYIWVVLLFIIMFVLTSSIFLMLCKCLFLTLKISTSRKVVDLNKDQLAVTVVLLFFCIALGLNPKWYMDFISWDMERLYIHIHGYRI